MFIITNRLINIGKTDVKTAFGNTPAAGPNTLRLAEALKENGKWFINVMDDVIPVERVTAEQLVSSSADNQVFASDYVASKLLSTLTSGNGKNLLLYVHGYNNDVKSVLDRAAELEANFNVEVLVFSWPANGGGGTYGLASYKSDKRDALASVGALSRVLGRMEQLLKHSHAAYEAEITALANKKHPDNAAAWDEFFSKHAEQRCKFTLNLMLHSMGNYLFKHLLTSSVFHSGNLLFDNIIMIAADTNNDDHAKWVDKIPFRNRLYITINEKDSALKASRLKMGEQQKARLGHYLRKLDSQIATYINVTNQPHIGSSHAYFEGKPLKNKQVRNFFQLALNGEVAENALKYDMARNVFHF